MKENAKGDGERDRKKRKRHGESKEKNETGTKGRVEEILMEWVTGGERKSEWSKTQERGKSEVDAERSRDE